MTQPKQTRTAQEIAEYCLSALDMPDGDLDFVGQRIEKAIQKERQHAEELEFLFELQHKRSIEAEALWCKAHGHEVGSIKPDLGKLLEWLMGKAEEAERLIKIISDMVIPGTTDSVDAFKDVMYQNKELRAKLSEAHNTINNVCLEKAELQKKIRELELGPNR